jgi:hypothetical protein
LQTFPDAWIFEGSSRSDIRKQIGNAVPVQFAHRIGNFLKNLHEAQTTGMEMKAVGQSSRAIQAEFDL